MAMNNEVDLSQKIHLSLLGINASMKIGMRTRRSIVGIPESMYCAHESDVNVMNRGSDVV